MEQSRPKEQTLVAVVFFLGGLGMLAVGIYLGWNSYRGLAGLERATATVTFVETVGIGDDLDYFPTVEFTTADGDFVHTTPAAAGQRSFLGGLIGLLALFRWRRR